MRFPKNDPRIEQVATSSLKPNPRNARTHSARQIEQIAASIERFGWLVPIVIDESNMILAGHGRWLAAKKLRLKEIAAIRAAFVTEIDRRAFALAENRIAQLSGWDQDLLDNELEFLFESGDLEISGFTTADLNFALPEAEDQAEQFELPDPAADAVSRPGDKWLIGSHRVICGDACLPITWEALLGEDRAHLVFADLPYNVPIDGHVSGSGNIRHREFVMGAGEMTQAEFVAFQRRIFRNCIRFSKDGSIHYQCMDWRHAREILDAADGIYSEFKQLVVWDKGVGGQGAFYRSQHELVFVFKSGTPKHTNTFGLGDKGRYRTNVVKYKGANSFRRGRKRDLKDHSTIKPTALVADFILDCSHPGEIVIDPCLGSGTTIIAAHRTKRRGAGIELDPLYVDTSLKRIADATGLSPVLDGDGRSFAEVAEARAAGREG